MAKQRISDEELQGKLKFVENERGCWMFSGYCQPSGYGSIWDGIRNRRAHRVVLEFKLGRKLAASELACHSCDTPACINPAHLWAGTPKQNSQDAARKGRMPRGETHGMYGRGDLIPKKYGESNPAAKLTTEQVAEIRSRIVPPKLLAEKFGITRNHVYKIRSGFRWVGAR